MADLFTFPKKVETIDRSPTIDGPPTVLNDVLIAEYATQHGMIQPFHDRLISSNEDGEKVLSYGLSSFGYDVRIARDFRIFSNANQGTGVVDPKNFDEKSYVEHTGDYVIIPAGGFVLARSVEFIKVPREVTVQVLGKSTYARCGVICIATPLEAGWEGYVTLEYVNGTPLPVKLYAEEGAAQLIFHRGPPCHTSYSDRGGKYQGQKAQIVNPLV